MLANISVWIELCVPHGKENRTKTILKKITYIPDYSVTRQKNDVFCRVIVVDNQLFFGRKILHETELENTYI